MPTSHMHKNEIKAIVLTYLFKNRFDKFSAKKIFFSCQIPSNCASIYNKTIAEILALEYINQDNEKLYWNGNYFIAQSFVFGRRFYAYYNNEKYRISVPIGSYPLDEDLVVVKIKDNKLLEAELVDILERTRKHIVGTLTTSANNGIAFVVPDDSQRYPTDIFIGSGQSVDPLSYCKVELQINRYETKRKPCGTIIRMIHNTINHLDKHIPAIMARYGLKYGFFQDELEAAEKTKKHISQNNYASRAQIDDRKVFIISDKETADIAFGIKKFENNFEVDICVPDMAAQITEGSVLDHTAHSRAFSILGHKHSIAMIPESATNNILFVEAQKRLSLVIRAIFDATGRLISFEPFEAVVCPQKRITAANINKYVEAPYESFEIQYCDVLDDFFKLQELFDLQNCNSLIFDKTISSSYSNELIACYKNIYDSAVAYSLHNMGVPFLYTVCDVPDEFDLHRLTIQCESIGMDLKAIENLLTSVDGAFDLVNLTKDKLVKKALVEQYKTAIPNERYSANQQEHYLLNAEYHCNASSPCDRYVDLFNQRIFKRYIRKTLMNEHVLNKLRKDIIDIAEHMNRLKKAVTEIQKELIGFELSAIFEQEKETVFDGVAYKITPSGVYTLLDNGVYGLLKAENHTLSDKVFQYEDRGEWKKIHLGDHIKVKFDYYDIKSKRIIFKTI